MTAVRIFYYSDVLCIWAYAAERRLVQLAQTFGGDIEIEARYCSVFPDAWGKIEAKWKQQGGFGGFNHHLLDVAGRFPHIAVSDRIWLDAKPRTSASAHLFLKAVELIERDLLGEALDERRYLDRLSTRAAWELRRAFFEFANDISDWRVHKEIANQIGVDYQAVDEKIRPSEAVARLAADYDLSQKHGVEGSPTLIMNDGRQKLFGNVGYRLIEANVKELLRRAPADEASWC